MKKLKFTSILALAIFVTTINTSCLKKQNLTDDNLGPAIDPNAVTEAFDGGVGPYSYSDIKTGEYTSFVLTQRIQDSYTITLEQQDITIRGVDVSEDSLRLDSTLVRLKYNGPETVKEQRDWTDYWPPTTDHAEEKPTYLFQILENVAFYACRSSEQFPRSCHQLQVTDTKYRVPISVAAQHQCPDIYNCYIDARRIEFDQVNQAELDKDGKPKRTHFSLVISKEVPFLSKLLLYCTKSIYEMRDSQKILAETCATVNSYKAGTP